MSLLYVDRSARTLLGFSLPSIPAREFLGDAKDLDCALCMEHRVKKAGHSLSCYAITALASRVRLILRHHWERGLDGTVTAV
jgi:hypothetical protein